MTEITYNIECHKGEYKENISFKFIIENNEIVDGYSFNPTGGWVNYNAFQQGWSEKNPLLNELLNAIRDYSQSMELEQLVSDSTRNDIGKKYNSTYYCDGNVNENGEYDFIVTIEDVGGE